VTEITTKYEEFTNTTLKFHPQSETRDLYSKHEVDVNPPG